jgi:WD40 repeat protein
MKYEMMQNKDGKVAIFEDGNQISDWFDVILMYERVYVGKKGNKQAIYDLKTGKRISDYFEEIYIPEPFKNLYIAGKDKKVAIFDLDGKRLTDWFDNIKADGLLEGKCMYYIAGKDGKEAIYDINGNRITDLYDDIKPIKGRDDFEIYIAGKKDKRYKYSIKYAIFEV